MTVLSYLREHDLATEAQIEEARHRAERSRMSVEAALYVIGAVSESALLEAFRSCHNWQTVSLSERISEPAALKMLSQSDAWSRCLLPLKYDESTSLLSLACSNPDDPSLGAWLRANLPERTAVLYAAIEPLLRTAIVERYRQHDQTPDRSRDHSAEQDKTAYVISDRWRTDQFLGHLLTNEGYQVFLADSPAELLADLSTIQPDLVVIREAAYACPSNYLESFHRLLPNARIRQFSNTTELVDPKFDWAELLSGTAAHFRLAATAAARAADLKSEQAVRLGRLVDQICGKMQLPAAEQLTTVTTAYLFDIAAIQSRIHEPEDRQQAFFMLLSSAGDAGYFPPGTLRIVRHMYRPLGQTNAIETQRPEFRQGNILTAADFYLHSLATEDKLTPGRFRAIEEHLRGQVGNLLLPEVAEALLCVLEEEVISPGRSHLQATALVLNQLHLPSEKLRICAQQSGFECMVTERVEAFVQRFRQLGPEVVVIAADGDVAPIRSLIDQLATAGIIYANVPTILLHRSAQHDRLYSLLRLGLYDVIRYDGGLEVLDLRLQRISTELERASRQRLNVLHDLGTHGSLAHMNVIDLLQAMGPSSKTMRISVTAQAKQLTMYLHNGQLLHAEADETTGCEAIYLALQWTRGIWSVDHIQESDLPEPNINRTIDSILIEGCHLLDEMQREPAPDFSGPDADAKLESIFHD